MQKYIARQPILDKATKTFGYELLFRSGLENFFICDNPDQASSSVVVDSYLLFGLNTLTQGRRAFINFTRNMVLRQFATLLPKDQIVIEIMENIDPDDGVVAACRSLKKQGYMLALDDFVLTEKIKPLIDLADIIKIDFLATPSAERRSLAKAMASGGIRLLAEKVETREQHREALEYGYQLFQGYFFSKPESLRARDIPAYKPNYLLLVQAIFRPEPDLREIEDIIKREPSLTYKLLRYLNSAAFAFLKEVTSIRHALSLLGPQEVRKWVSLVSLAAMGENRPKALIVDAITRARFCEQLAGLAGCGDKAIELFLVGLLSLIDAILQRPMPEILEQISVSNDVRAALLDTHTRWGEILELAIAFERVDWGRISHLVTDLRLNETVVGDSHIHAIEWGHQIFHVDDSVPVAC